MQFTVLVTFFCKEVRKNIYISFFKSAENVYYKKRVAYIYRGVWTSIGIRAACREFFSWVDIPLFSSLTEYYIIKSLVNY